MASPSPQAPRDRDFFLTILFWVAFWLPLGFALLMVATSNSDTGMIFFFLSCASAILSSLYCGCFLAFLWAKGSGTRTVLSLVLVVGLAFFYLAAAFAGCASLFSY